MAGFAADQEVCCHTEYGRVGLLERQRGQALCHVEGKVAVVARMHLPSEQGFLGICNVQRVVTCHNDHPIPIKTSNDHNLAMLQKRRGM